METDTAAQRLRLVALALKRAPPQAAPPGMGDVTGGYTLLAPVGIIDAPREEAIQAVAGCHRAGIRVKMITGDHADTARSIGAQLAIGGGKPALTGAEVTVMDEAELRRVAMEVDVFARASPEHKLRLVQALQEDGQGVAMTGDGVNDAPALKGHLRLSQPQPAGMEQGHRRRHAGLLRCRTGEMDTAQKRLRRPPLSPLTTRTQENTMNPQQDRTTGLPTRLLLCTDLSARCDRALDRAALLARHWDAELIALNVLEPQQAPDLLLRPQEDENDTGREQAAYRQLKQDLGQGEVRLHIRIARGDALDAIHATAEQEGCGLIITGLARNETFGRFLLGSTVQRLARKTTPPLLVVRERPHASYRRIVVASDFSNSSRHALLTALRLFPDTPLTLYHAFQVPMSAIADRIDYRQMAREIEGSACAQFLDGCGLTTENRARLDISIEHQPLETGLAHYARKQSADLVVLGTHGSSGLTALLLGSAAERLLEWLPCDTLIVREPKES